MLSHYFMQGLGPCQGLKYGNYSGVPKMSSCTGGWHPGEVPKRRRISSRSFGFVQVGAWMQSVRSFAKL